MSTDELRSVFGGFGIGIVCAFPLGYDDIETNESAHTDTIPLHKDQIDWKF